jgi:[ribosomal protein S18]-alanine N-acetyltransferase
MGADDLEAVSLLEASLQSFPWSTGNFADSLAAGHDARVLRSGSEVVGFSVVMNIVDEAHLLNIGIAKHYQGQGHGARLLRQIIDAARAAGVVRLLLEVRPSNRRAIDFYQAFGFRQIGVRRGYYPAALGREDALVFDKELQ